MILRKILFWITIQTDHMFLALLRIYFYGLIIILCCSLLFPIILSWAFEKRFCRIVESAEGIYQDLWWIFGLMYMVADRHLKSCQILTIHFTYICLLVYLLVERDAISFKSVHASKDIKTLQHLSRKCTTWRTGCKSWPNH